MPKYYCDYCDTYLTHDSPSVRKTHNGGRKHLENVVNFYQQLQDQEIQRKVDSTIQSFTSGFRNAMGGMPPMMPPVMGNPFMQPNFYHPGMSFPPIPIPSPGTFPPGPVPPGFNESLPLPPGPPVPPLAGPPNHFPPTGHPGQLMGPPPNFQQQQRVSQFS